MARSIKLILLSGVIVLAFCAFINYQNFTSGKLIYRTTLRGTTEESQIIKFFIEDPDSPYVLIIQPFIERGWGGPNVFIKASLYDPERTMLINIDRTMIFGASKKNFAYVKRPSDYEEKFLFYSTVAGEYTLALRVLTTHVEEVKVSIAKK